jgi:hypothetical protein
MKPPIDVQVEKKLFERAVVAWVEAKLAGKTAMHAPPEGVNACWLHSHDMIPVPDGGAEYWVRLQCYCLGGPNGDVKLWTMFCWVRSEEDHPLIELHHEVTHR